MSNLQNLNRYMYALGNPLKYTDPTGHEICTDDGLCGSTNVTAYWNKVIKDLSSSYGITFSGKWKQKDKLAVVTGVMLIGTRLAETTSGSADAAFSKVFKNGVNFTWGGEGAGYGCTSVSSGGCTSSASQINFWSMSNDMVKNVVHELGHAFYKAAGNPLLGNAFSRDALIRNESYGGGEALVWEQHPISMNDPQEDIPTELFADTFIAWTYDTWNSDPDFALDVNNARNEMDRIARSIP